MEYDDEQYPHSREGLPNLPDLLDTVDWDVLCIFDACRWDAFEEYCESSEPVRSEFDHTFEWVKQVWCNDEYDWTDVTYVSGNIMTGQVEESDGFDDALGNHVEEHVKGFEDFDVFHHLVGTTDPQKLAQKAELHEPPIVVHFMQPHNPFIGNIHVNASKSFEYTEMPLDGPEKISCEAKLVETGHVSLEMYRAAYLENLKLVWKKAEILRDRFDKVITTADHGEVLGPDSFGHGSGTNQGDVVPFHTNWDVELPDPGSVGAAAEHEWETRPGTTQESGDTGLTQEEDEELQDKLRALGYSA